MPTAMNGMTPVSYQPMYYPNYPPMGYGYAPMAPYGYQQPMAPAYYPAGR
jgi:hypothetical protein